MFGIQSAILIPEPNLRHQTAFLKFSAVGSANWRYPNLECMSGLNKKNVEQERSGTLNSRVLVLLH